MKTRPKDSAETNDFDTDDNRMAEMVHSMNQGIMLRGSVYETGGIHSFWIKSSQKNMIAMLFELPNKPVKIGDSWTLEINFITNDQNFKCDSAFKANKVTLIDLKQVKGETIAVLKYEFEEYVEGIFNSPAMFRSGGAIPTTMKFTFHALAEFSIKKGRWLSYDGIMSLKANGVMTANTKKKFSLIEK